MPQLLYACMLFLYFVPLRAAAGDPAGCDCSGSLLVNAGFEQGTNGWRSAGGTFLATAGSEGCGNRYGLLDARSSRARVWQESDQFPGNSILALSFQAAAVDPGQSRPYIEFAFYTPAGIYLAGKRREIAATAEPTGASLQEYLLSVNAPPGAGLLVIEAFAETGYLKLDRFCLAVVRDEIGSESGLENSGINGQAIQDQPAGLSEVRGRIWTSRSAAVSGVEVSMDGTIEMKSFSAPDGTFAFEAIPRSAQSPRITPHLDNDHLAGISALDLLLLQKFLLGETSFSSPYQHIAADVNNSQTITTLDLITLRKLLLGDLHRFPENTSWRFIVADHHFVIPANPWFDELPESAEISLSREVLEVEFIGIKIGDINGSFSVQRSSSAAQDRELTVVSPAIPQQQPMDKERLYQNQPNPFRSTTTIGFDLLQSGKAHLRIFDSLGGLAKEWRAFLESGHHEFQLKREHLPAGHYYYQLETDQSVITKKLLVVN